jgi:SAM-dependent methyltransferase
MDTPEFTGERYIPGQGGAQIGYEHLHRYLFARRLAAGREVVDIAAGSGYGAALLSKEARHVWAVELDASAVRHARRTFPSGSIAFVQADAARLPVAGGSADLVVALEVLEHVLEQELLVDELARVCRPDGLVLISTPNKAVYSDARGYSNPFHVREFYRDDFLALMGARFRSVVLYQQQVRAGSFISGQTGCGWEVVTEPAPDESRPLSEPMYFLALCTNGAVSQQLLRGSAYLDLTDALISEWAEEAARLNRHIEELGKWALELGKKVAECETQIGERDATIRALQAEMAREIAARDASLVSLQGEFDDRSRWAAALQKDVAERDGQLRHANEELERVGDHLALIRHHLIYRMLCRLRILPK